jgi:hypothetical protein
MTRWPAKSLSVTVDKSVLTSLKSGALVFFGGNSPLVAIDAPLEMIVAMNNFY